MKVDNKGKYRLVFSIVKHSHLGVLIHPYVIALSNTGILTLTYQKVFSGNASYYSQLSETDLEKIKCLDDLMEDAIVRKFSPEKKIRPKEYFRKHHSKLVQTEVIRPYIEKRINDLLKLMDSSTPNLYRADDINPAAYPIRIQDDFTKVLFHFHRNENGTNYFVTIKHNDERIPFMKLGSVLLTKSPARLVVSGHLYKFYDFVDGAKLAVFVNKKSIHIRPESEKNYYAKFIKPLLETAPVFIKGFEVVTLKESATPALSLHQQNDKFGFNVQIRYQDKIFPFHQNKMYHVTLDWIDNQPKFTKYKRSQIWEANRINALAELGLKQISGSFFTLSDTTLASCIDWLRTHKELLVASHFELNTKINEVFSVAKFSLNYKISDKIDWFDLNVEITIGEFTIPFSKIVKEIKNGNDRIVLPNGEIFLFPKEWFALGEALANQGQKNNLYKIKKYQVDVLSLIQSKKIKQHLTKLVAIKPESPNKAFRGKLRQYQNDGLSWLIFLRNNRFGGILADDMGLGKTVQTLAFIQHSKSQIHLEKQKHNPKFLLVAPTSLLYNWVHECNQFTPDIKTIIHTGVKRSKEPGSFDSYDLIITTYGLIRNDQALFSEMHFDTLILDESQNIKNHTAKTTQSINKLTADCRIALTGTPIENTIRDLWSQMNVLNKGLLGSLKQFESKYAKPIEKDGDNDKAEELHKIIKPFLLRRTKEEVATELPPLTEKIVFCEMSNDQSEFYEKIKSEYRNNILDVVDKKGLKKSKLSILQGLSKLRQLANHPKLIDANYSESSGKHDVLIDKIKNTIEDGHKLLVFSQFVTYLELIEKDIVKLGLPYFKLTGSTTKEKRAYFVEEFQAKSEATVFLISLKAGGTGLNLTSANYVFIVDPWWNPAAEAQARDRTHRIGQKNNVFSYKFISRDTIEEKITELQRKKKGFSKDIIVSENNVLSNLDMGELEFLLS